VFNHVPLYTFILRFCAKELYVTHLHPVVVTRMDSAIHLNLIKLKNSLFSQNWEIICDQV